MLFYNDLILLLHLYHDTFLLFRAITALILKAGLDNPTPEHAPSKDYPSAPAP